jgi:hypothetical protein
VKFKAARVNRGRVYLYTLEMKVSVMMLNTSIKLVFVLPVANFIAVMMKASSEEAL